jgi:hypothetical protein
MWTVKKKFVELHRTQPLFLRLSLFYSNLKNVKTKVAYGGVRRTFMIHAQQNAEP